jgi:phosphate-selective porin OprO/OprP
MERALTDAYADRRKVGGEVLLRKKIDNNHLNIFFDVFSNSIDERRDTDIDHPGYSTRAVYAYKAKKYKLFSLGGAYMYQNYNGDSIKYNQSAESDLIYNKYVSVKIRNVESVEKSNVESAIVYDKLSLQGEYSTTNVQTDINDYNFNGYYAQASYFLLGKGRRYKTETSTFGKINPNNDTALEVAFRYSYINLNDKDEHGGEQTDYNFGVNWYITREFKWMFNYIMAYPNDTDDYDGLLQIWQMRLLFAF